MYNRNSKYKNKTENNYYSGQKLLISRQTVSYMLITRTMLNKTSWQLIRLVEDFEFYFLNFIIAGLQYFDAVVFDCDLFSQIGDAFVMIENKAC